MNKDEINDLTNILRNYCDNTPNEDCVGCDCDECGAKAIINAGYRKVGKDEIVIKKSEYETLKKDKNDYKQRFESSDKRFEQLLRTSVETVEKKHQYWENKCKEIGDVASKETAREILQELYDEAMRNTKEVVELTVFEIKQLAKEKGIELED